jgi:hypothetical protein
MTEPTIPAAAQNAASKAIRELHGGPIAQAQEEPGAGTYAYRALSAALKAVPVIGLDERELAILLDVCDYKQDKTWGGEPALGEIQAKLEEARAALADGEQDG